MISVPLAEAKNRFSELVNRAAKGEDIAVTKHGKLVVRLVAVEEPADARAERARRAREAFARLDSLRSDKGPPFEDLKAVIREGAME